MDLTELLLILALLWKMTLGLRCYKCQAQFVSYAEPMCEHFDQSDQFYTECERSSMCYKRVTTTQFGTVIYERGCAKQIVKDIQEYDSTLRKWKEPTTINEPYKEGCVKSPGDNDMRVTRTEHCYCRGDLCNAAGLTTSSVLSIVMYAMGVLFLS